MTTRPVLLLDLDGVVLDVEQYLPEWERLAGEAFAPLLGGEPDRWILAIREAWHGPRHAEYLQLLRTAPSQAPTPAEWDRDVHADWIERSCRLIGVDPPGTVAQRYEAAVAAKRHYYLNTRASAAAREPLQALAANYELHAASGNSSWLVDAALEGAGVRDRFGTPFGWDLVGVPKDDPEAFYAAIVDQLEVAAGRRVTVVDDLPEKLDAAASLGLETVLVSATPSASRHRSAGSLAEAAELLALG